MRKGTKIVAVVGTALSLGLAAAELSAQPSGMGWAGHGSGFGMHGSAMGYGMGPGAGMGYAMRGNGMGPGAGMGYGMHGYGMGYGMHGDGMGFNAQPEAVENRLLALKTELGITAEQESAWQAFVDHSNTQAESRQAWFAKLREAQSAGTAPELFAQRAEIAKQRQVALQSTTTALRNLYAVLRPEQKAVADRAFGGFGPGYRGGPIGRVR